MEQKTVEEYIEVIDALQKEDEYARTGRVAELLHIKPPSVTEMMRKLEGEGLVEYEPYHGARLTPQGEKIAAELRRRHGIIARFLQLIGVSSETAEQDACQIEHHVTQETVSKLTEFMEHLQEEKQEQGLVDKMLARITERRE